MKNIFKFLFGGKNEYIGLSDFREMKTQRVEIKKETKSDFNKTSLTGLIRRAN